MNCKPDALVYGTVRPIAGSLLVAGALFCLGLMSVHAQTVDFENGLVAYYPFNGNASKAHAHLQKQYGISVTFGGSKER